jgi:hypothetical protein
MTAKEYRDKEAITDGNFWDGDEIDFNMVYEFAEDYHKSKLNLLNIDVVSNRRELLCAFFKFFRDNGEANIGMTIEQFVDAFLSTQ